MKKNYIFPIIMLVCMIIGSLTGILFPTFSTYLKPFGDIFINLMFTIVVPLVFFTITSSIANMSNIKKLSKILKNTILVFVITSLIATLFMLFMTYVVKINPTNILMQETLVEKQNVLDQIVSAITVNDFGNLLSRKNMLPLIIFSVIFGISLNVVDKEKRVSKTLNTISNTLMHFVKIIMYYAPIGIFAYFASIVSEFGSELLGSYAKTMLIYYVGTVIYFLVFYTLYAYLSDRKNGVKRFYKNIFPSMLTSLATQSSLATLPTNLKTSKDMEIDKDVANVSLPIGCTIHMEGSSMGAILKIVFLFSIFNMHMTPSGLLLAILISVLSGVVMSGIPGGGLIGEALIVSLYGFPIEAFLIISTIGWLIDPPATMLNVCGDITSSMLVDKYVNKKV